MDLAQVLAPIKSLLENITTSTSWGAQRFSIYNNRIVGDYDQVDRAIYGHEGEFGGFKDFNSLRRLEIVPQRFSLNGGHAMLCHSKNLFQICSPTDISVASTLTGKLTVCGILGIWNGYSLSMVMAKVIGI